MAWTMGTKEGHYAGKPATLSCKEENILVSVATNSINIGPDGEIYIYMHIYIYPLFMT